MDKKSYKLLVEAEIENQKRNYEFLIMNLIDKNILALERQKKRDEKRRQKIVLEERQKTEQNILKLEQETQTIKRYNQLLRLKIIKIMLQQGETIPTITETLQISIEETDKLVELIQKE